MEMLKGIKVLSFNHFLLGPVGCQVLADLGADVIGIEPIEGSFQRRWGGANRKVDGDGVLHLCGGRNKRSLAINIKSPEGRTIVEKLIATADVISENFRPGVMDRLELGYDAARKINPQIIFAAASGFGVDGPYRDRPGQDLVAQAMSGLGGVTGSVDQPPTPVGVSAIDHHGAQILAMSVLAALFNRERTNKGCRIDLDLLSAGLDLQMESFVAYANGEPISLRPPANIAAWSFPAPYGFYKVLDGFVAISLAAMEPLSKALGVPALKDFDTDAMFAKNGEIAALIQDAVLDLTTDELEKKLESQNLWFSRVNDYEGVMADPQVQHNGSFLHLESSEGTPITLLAHPVKYDGCRPGVRQPPQPLGAQTAEILKELGYASTEITDLAQSGVVRMHKSE